MLSSLPVHSCVLIRLLKIKLFRSAQSLVQHCDFNHHRSTCPCFCTAYRFPKISEKGVIFLLVWNLFFAISLTMCISELLIDNYTVIEFLSIPIICPVIGLLCDCWIGRFKILKVSTYFLLVAIVLKGVTIIITSPVALHLAVAIWTLSLACCLTCIIQFTIDQLIGASGEELSFVIYWLLWGLTTGDLIYKTAGCLLRLSDWQFMIMSFVASTATFIISFIMMGTVTIC